MAWDVEVEAEGDSDKVANWFAAIDMNTAETGGRFSLSESSESSMFPEYCQNIVVNGNSERTRRVLGRVVVDSGGVDSEVSV